MADDRWTLFPCNDSENGWIWSLPFPQLFHCPSLQPFFQSSLSLCGGISAITILSFLTGNFRDQNGYRANLQSAIRTFWPRTLACQDPRQAICISMMTTLPMYCNVPASTIPLAFEPGLIAYSKSRTSALTNSAKESDPLVRSLHAGWIVTFLPSLKAPDTPVWQPAILTRPERNMTISRLWTNYQCAGLHPGLRTSPQCKVPAPTAPLVFEPVLIAYSESRASTLTNSAKESDSLARS